MEGSYLQDEKNCSPPETQQNSGKTEEPEFQKLQIGNTDATETKMSASLPNTMFIQPPPPLSDTSTSTKVANMNSTAKTSNVIPQRPLPFEKKDNHNRNEVTHQCEQPHESVTRESQKVLANVEHSVQKKILNQRSMENVKHKSNLQDNHAEESYCSTQTVVVTDERFSVAVGHAQMGNPEYHAFSPSQEELRTASLKQPQSKEPFHRSYHVGKVLGKGGFGIVYEGTRIQDGLQVALKHIAKSKINEFGQVSQFKGEILLNSKQSTYSSPFVILTYVLTVFLF